MVAIFQSIPLPFKFFKKPFFKKEKDLSRVSLKNSSSYERRFQVGLLLVIAYSPGHAPWTACHLWWQSDARHPAWALREALHFLCSLHHFSGELFPDPPSLFRCRASFCSFNYLSSVSVKSFMFFSPFPCLCAALNISTETKQCHSTNKGDLAG